MRRIPIVFAFWVLLFCTTGTGLAVAQNKIVLEGKSKFPQKELRVYADASIFTENLQFLAHGKTDAQGNFELRFALPAPAQRIVVEIENIRTRFWVTAVEKRQGQQEKKYAILFPSLKKKSDPTQFLPYYREVVFQSLDSNELAFQLHLLQKQDFSQKDCTLPLPSSQNLVPLDKNPILSQCYLHFEQAKQLLMRRCAAQNIYNHFLAPLTASVGCANTAFFYDFFEVFYKNFLELPSFLLYKEAYLEALKQKASLSKIDYLLAAHAFLQKPEWRKLFLLLNLKDLYLNKKISVEILAFYLQEIQNKHAKDKTLLGIINSYRQNFLALRIGATPPQDVWKILSQHWAFVPHKPVYLAFINSACKNCDAQLQALALFAEKHRDQVQVGVVHLGPKAEKNTYNLPIYEATDAALWIQQWKLQEVPTYILIDKAQKIQQFPAFGPLPNYHGRTIGDLFESTTTKNKDEKI